MIGLLVALLFAAPAAAQDCGSRSDALILAALSVHEAGWYADDDMRGIHAVLVTLAEDWSTTFSGAACRHSRRFMEGRTARPWASDLVEDCTTPARWPTTVVVRDGDTVRVAAHPPFANFCERWLGRLALAHRILAAPPVTREAHTWGGRLDFSEGRRRALSGTRVFVEVVIGETRNHFGRWVTP